MKKIIILPLDDRACTYNFPKQIAEIYNIEALLPPIEFMGNLEKIADREKIISFIKAQKNIDGMVLAADTLAYGGLIPSRKTQGTFEQIIKNFEIIKELKNIYVCTTIQRISDSNENQEEKEYWKDYGKLIHKYSYLIHENKLIDFDSYQKGELTDILKPKLELLPEESLEEDLKKLKEQIPNEILEDYLNDRVRNLKVNMHLIEMVKKGELDFLVISSDDSAKFGFNVIERNILLQKIEVLGLKNKVILYPGADESVSVLTARLINKLENFTPKFYVEYSDTEKKENSITMYEGIPIKETLKFQINALGGEITNKLSDSEAIIYIHLSQEEQEDHYLKTIYKEKIIKVDNNIIENDINRIKQFLSDNKRIILIDSAYANGANHDFMFKLAENIDLTNILAFSAWNTTGNRIGTAIAHASTKILTEKNKNNFEATYLQKEENHYNFLLERFFDDWLYQGLERLSFIEKNGFPLNSKQLEELKNNLENRIKEVYTNNLNLKLNFYIDKIFFPWNRPFEVSIKLKK